MGQVVVQTLLGIVMQRTARIAARPRPRMKLQNRQQNRQQNTQHTDSGDRLLMGIVLQPQALWFCLLKLPPTAESAQFEVVLTESVAVVSDTDLTPACAQVIGRCRSQLGSELLSVNCWLGARRAECIVLPIAQAPSPGTQIHLDLHQQLAGRLAAHLAQLACTDAVDVGPLSDNGWLERTRPQAPPKFDYLLRPSQHQPATAIRQLANAPVEACLWWTPDDADRAHTSVLERADLPVVGLVPEGVALYLGLRRRWQQQGLSLAALAGDWVLLELSHQPSAWFFRGSWFVRHQSHDCAQSLDQIGVTAGHKVIVWHTSVTANMPPGAAGELLDHNLQNYEATRLGGALELPGLIALGLAMHGSVNRVSDWLDDAGPPRINLLAWRVARVRQLRQRMMRRMIAIFGLAVAALLFSIALLGEGVVARQQQLALLQQQYQQQQEDSRHADQVHLQGEQSRIAGAVLQKFAAAGSRQLERLRRLLQLLPECAQLTAIKASASAVILSGVAADPRSLEQLPDAIFAAFAEAEQPELAAWPVLLTGPQAADFSSAEALPGRFVLRLAFVESQRAAKAKATAFGSDS